MRDWVCGDAVGTIAAYAYLNTMNNTPADRKLT